VLVLGLAAGARSAPGKRSGRAWGRVGCSGSRSREGSMSRTAWCLLLMVVLGSAPHCAAAGV